jgi:2,5-furandicarboxylate decarboxylase 1
MFREFIKKLEKSKEAAVITKPVSRKFEASAILKALEPKTTIFNSVCDSEFRVAGNVFASRAAVASFFGWKPNEIVQKMLNAVEKPTKPEVEKAAPFKEIVETGVDLNKLPILTHCEFDGGPYVSSGVIVANDREYGRNLSFHRLMQFEKNKFAVRILPRHLHEFVRRNNGELDVAVCIGTPLNFLLTGATSVGLGVDEMTIANALQPITTSRCYSLDIEVPCETEFVLEGRITSETHSEGKFVDLTETYDIVREQPVLEIKRITHRKDAIYHALLPGGLEHKVLMGLPREPTIFSEVSKVCKCSDVYLTPGGASWLHGIVQIDKKKEEEGRLAIEAAFKGHASMKHVVIVDKDIELTSPSEVEWAIATRFQAKTGAVIKPDEKGSSLDPSADPETRATSKVGIDATKPLKAKGKDFTKAKFPKVDLKKFLE